LKKKYIVGSYQKLNSQIFIPNQVYRRKDIHQHYGGSGWGGIAPSGKFPYIFIFSLPSGHQHGYKDQWENEDIFSYTGEGQEGDMHFDRNNLALLHHKKTGKRVFLFMGVRKAFVKFVQELELQEVDYFKGLDRLGNQRTAIKFFFKRVGIQLPYEEQKPMEILSREELANYNTVPSITERKGLVTSRVGQGAYRKSILYRWEFKCAVTGFSRNEILIASHIVPWKDASDEQRLDVNNGILLSPNYDALFDKNLISFENNGKIIISDRLAHSNYKVLGLTGNENIKQLNSENHFYLDKHRSRLLNN
jgi:5-methylcytosine-specific restriction enzyme A